MLMGWPEKRPKTRGFFSVFVFPPEASEKPMKNVCTDGLWWVQKVRSESRWHVLSILFWIYFPRCRPLCLNSEARILGLLIILRPESGASLNPDEPHRFRAIFE